MTGRPILNKNIDSKTFREFYFLKEELLQFCRDNGLPTNCGMLEPIERIALWLPCFADVDAEYERPSKFAPSQRHHICVVQSK